MDNDVTPSRKRALSGPDDEAPTPASLKKRRLDDVNGDSPSTPKALTAIASAISGAFGYGRPAQKPANGNVDEVGSAPAQKAPAPPPASAPPKPRPAIKLAALRGTVWDTGEKDKPRSTTPKKSTTPKRAPASKSRPVGTGFTNGQRTQNDVNGTGGYESTDELSGGDATTPSGRKYFSAKHAAGSPAPKGILTPTKNRGPRAPKNVSFGGKANGEVFFEDLPKGTPKKPKTPKPRRSRDEPAPDEIVCEICSRPDSKDPNQIILCDNCDFAVHQECYDVPEIPTGDWLCKSCAQEDVLKTPSKPTEDAAVSTKVAEVPEIPNLEQHLRAHQRVLLDRCAGRKRIQMFGQDEVYEKARQLVEQTVVAGEGNSMLLIGARGSGKTTLVENVITDLSREHRHEFHVVRLSGFIHTDDKLALKEIWRQLGKEMEVEDDLVNRSNYADTMASLLALLSHPSEIIGAEEGVTSQSVVFVIDEFDMFAAHPRQTLLYNLFDIAQSRKAPVAVLGCTTRLDVVEMLEKRVKSRFSHRYVYLSLPRTLPAYWQICRQGLMVDKPDASRDGIDVGLEGYDEFRKYWSRKIEELYKQRPFQDLLQYHYYTTKSASAFFTEWMLPLSSLSANDLTLSIPSAGSELTSLSPPDSRMQLLSALSDLDLGLLIAAARLDIVAHTDTVNFAMAYDEYSSLVGRQRVQSATSGMLAAGGGVRVWSRGVAGIAWERLIGLGLLVPAGIGGGRTLGYSGLDGKMWKVDVALEEIPSGAKLSQVLARWCKEI